ncbi:MAG: HlyD family efflux transporter periplasmic adaptor subunit [Verrucomicrobiales bacterium]
MEVAQLNRLLVDTDVSEVDVAKLHAGMEVTLEFDSLPDLAVPGKITYVSPSAELENPKNQQSTAKVFPITVAFATEDPRVRPGMTAKVRVTISTAQQVLAARLPSLFLEDGKSVVYVKAGAEFARKEVEVGISDTDVVEIKSGLAEGDQLATRKPFGEDTPASSGGRGRRGRS